MRRPLAKIAVLVVVFSLSGCVFTPSDPKTVPIAVRMDGDVVSVLVPQCPGGSVESAYVDDLGAGRARGEVLASVGVRDETVAAVILVALLFVLLFLTVRDVARRDKAQQGIFAAMNDASPARLIVIALVVLVALASGVQRI